MPIAHQAEAATPLRTSSETIAYSACTEYIEAEGETNCVRTGLFRIRVDGSRRRLLAQDASDPEWSPDGRRLAFAGRGGIWVSRPDGSGGHRVTRARRRGVDDAPSWAPDGRRIVFHREWERRGGAESTVDLYILDLQTRRVERLTRTPDNWEFEPDWSPDGRHIAFERGEGDDDDGIFLLELSSGRTTRLFKGWWPATPRWSPDGRQIAIADGSGVVVIGRDGRGRRLLVRQRSLSAVSWSSDGSRIAYTRIAGEGRQTEHLMVVGREGRRRTRFLVHGNEPDWRPRLQVSGRAR